MKIPRNQQKTHKPPTKYSKILDILSKISKISCKFLKFSKKPHNFTKPRKFPSKITS